MKKDIITYCRLCGQEIHNKGRRMLKLYCSGSHKTMWYNSLREKGMNKNPQAHIRNLVKTSLSEEANELYQKVEVAKVLPAVGKSRKWAELLIRLDQEMGEGEIRRVESAYVYLITCLKELVGRYKLGLSVFGRTVDGKKYVYFEKRVK